MMIRRRAFIKNMAYGSAFALGAPGLPLKGQNPSNQRDIRIGLIGKGAMGTADLNTALSVPGVKVVAVCDLYDQRLKDAKQTWGDHLLLTKDYHEVLQMEKLDAVIVATPDHWHQTIAIDALNAGKHVYCEKPVIHSLNQIEAYLKAEKKSNTIFQVGSQGMASLGNRKAAQLLQAGAIGQISLIEASFTVPPQPKGVYPCPADASPDTIDWKRFLGSAPQRDFDPQRFFFWRNWFDYGTGIAGDLFVHVFASLHSITGSPGPRLVYVTGATNYYNDGFRDTPDLMLGIYDYLAGNGSDSFKVTLSANMADGVSNQWGSMNFRIIGDKGVMEVGWDHLRLKTNDVIPPSFFQSLPAIGQGIDLPENNKKEWWFKAQPDYKGGHYDHFCNFFDSILTGKANKANLIFGLQSAAPALLSNLSFAQKSPISWDPIQLKAEKRG